jgi:stress-induced morphogen
MAISIAELDGIIKQSFPSAKIKLTDLAGDEDHYALEIEDASFAGQSLINQHKMVKSALSEVMERKLHAITIKTITAHDNIN